ncbi:hypothetical protein IVA95_24615 [Bradyrhizobium sp. 157]|uniref:hypothetical protein n=1 Tax=Bradyrhizobium sp. 157 TaxID=2782631 RepID=UPI001FFA47A1|nr:hypothetical protein [Bradyrhizobium sp. 157]MCK1640679.1 hypothetical protein [Bradyrhizobium sp. 157]
MGNLGVHIITLNGKERSNLRAIDGYLSWTSARNRTHQMCVILTRAGISSQIEPELHHCRRVGGNQRCQGRGALPHEHPMTKETTPLWVWLSIALLAIGTLGYVTAVYLVEHVMGLF